MRRSVRVRLPGHGAAHLMRFLIVRLVSVAFALALTPSGGLAAQTLPDEANSVATTFVPVCPGPASPGSARCHALLRTDARARPNATVGPAGYGPADLLSAYALANAASTSGIGATVAIVDAYNDPNAESDLGVYRSQFNLPACTTANGCFKKVNQSGGTIYPASNGGWAQEISLDLDMVSAICPQCHILLVEANSNAWSDLTAAVDYAATVPGVAAIGNSYGGGEGSGETLQDPHYNHPGIAITASTGDNGYGVQYPAASPYVTAVGGTTLNRATNSRAWSETAWSGAGSGCSAYESKPSWQLDAGCSRRTVADVSAVADPNTGVAVYDSYSYLGSSGWLVFGGTSVAAPIIASVYALGGHTASLTYGSSPYSNASSLFDVISGSTGSCGGSYLCTASSGYDGPTGLGTPNGTTAFGGSSSGGSTPLTVQINQAAGQADPTSQSPINFSVLFSESVADFTTGDVTLGGTAGANTATVTGSGTTYNVALSGMAGSGSVIATIAAGVAHDAANNANAASTSTDNVVTFDVTGPTVSITSPASGATVSGTAVTVAATAGDTSGVAAVQFYLDGSLLGTEVTSAPYSTNWDTTKTTDGPHTLTAVARDTLGNTTTSSGVGVTVSNNATVTVPAAPTNLTAKAVGGRTASQINLSWTDNSNNEQSFVIARSADGGVTFPIIATVAANTTSYSDKAVLHGVTYTYKVGASNSAGPAAYSSTATATAK